MQTRKLFSRIPALILVLGLLSSSAWAMGKPKPTHPPIPPQRSWDAPKVLELAKELYSITWKVSATANAEFPGGAPGQDELYRLSESSRTYYLTIQDLPNDTVETGRWFEPIPIYIWQAENIMPACRPGYGDYVINGFAYAKKMAQEIALYYPSSS